MNVRIIIMGKTGAGKSTLVNSLLSKNVAKTGVGSAITLENQQYSLFTTFDNQQVHIDIYDTVGLELDSKKNKKTLDEAQAYIKFLPSDAISVVWYCINPNCNKFEQFELELIDELSYKYEIPFIVVLTQSWNNYCSKALINKLLIKHPELIIMSVLAEKYETDIGIIQPFGMDRLLSKSIYDYNDLKIEILDNKLNKLQKTEDEYQMLKQKAKSIVYHYSDKAFKFGCIPIVSIFSFQTLYGKMLGDIANVYGVKLTEDNKISIIALWCTVAILTPIFAIPFISGKLAQDMMEDDAMKYIGAIETAFRHSDGSEDNQVMIERIKTEFSYRKGKK